MRIARSICLLILLDLSSPLPVRAETTIYFRGHALEVPPPVMLLVGGLALIAVGGLIRRWFERTQAPESEQDDVKAGPLPEPIRHGIDQVADGRPEISRPAA